MTELLDVVRADRRSSPRPVLAVLRAETRLFLRDPLTAVIGIALPSVILVGLGAIPALRVPSEAFAGRAFIEFFAPSLLAVSIAALGLQNLPATLATYRERGILRRLSTTPMTPAAVLVAQLLINVVTAALGTALLVAVAVVHLGMPAPHHPLGFTLAFLAGTSAVFALGLLVAALAPRARVATGIGTVVFMVTQFFAGVYLPKFLLPDGIVRIGEYVPPGITAFQDAWTGDGAAPLPLAVMVLIAVGATAVAARLFRWE